MAQKRIICPFPNSLLLRIRHDHEKRFCSSASLLWITGFIAIILISSCCDIAQAHPSQGRAYRRRMGLGVQDENKFQQGDGDGADLADPYLGRVGGFDDVGRYPNVYGEQVIHANDINPRHRVHDRDAYIRPPRAAAYVRRIDDDDMERKHYDRIPTSRLQIQNGSARRGEAPPPEESDEDDFESLEANREAFLEILQDHAKHPHRRRSLKRHSSKIQLKYNQETNRYSMVEEQSEEW